jgi:hypothetical protein
MVCLKEAMRQSILHRLHGLWANIFANKVPKYRNEILLCTNSTAESLFYKQPFDSKKSGQHNLNTTNGDVMTQFQEFYKSVKEIKF